MKSKKAPYRSLRNTNHWIKEWKKQRRKTRKIHTLSILKSSPPESQWMKTWSHLLSALTNLITLLVLTLELLQWLDFYFPKDIIGQYIFRCETLEDHYEGKNPSFGEVMARLKNDADFDELVKTLQMYYQDSIFIVLRLHQ